MWRYRYVTHQTYGVSTYYMPDETAFVVKHDYENYGFFFEELQKSMEEKLECKVLSIKDGVNKINNRYKH